MSTPPNRSGLRRGSHIVLISGIVLLVVLLVGGSVFFVMKVKGSSLSFGNGNGSPTAPDATPTPSVQLTPQPLFFDNFSTAKKGWVITKGADYSRVIEHNRLIMTASNHKIIPESLPVDNTFDDVMVTVSFTLTQAQSNDGAGIYIRGDSNLDHDYRIEIYGNTTYGIGKEYLDSANIPQTLSLAGPEKNAALRPLGRSNTVTVIAKGPTLVVLFNGQVAKRITDATYAKGQIALFVQNDEDSDGVTAAFSQVVVYPAPDRLPG